MFLVIVQLFVSCNKSENNKKALLQITEKYKQIVKHHENEVRENIHESLDSFKIKIRFYEKNFDVQSAKDSEQNRLSNLIYLRSSVIDSMLLDYRRIYLIESRCNEINGVYTDKFESFTDSIFKVYDIDFKSSNSICDILMGYFSDKIVILRLDDKYIRLCWQDF